MEISSRRIVDNNVYRFFRDPDGGLIGLIMVVIGIYLLLSHHEDKKQKEEEENERRQEEERRRAAAEREQRKLNKRIEAEALIQEYKNCGGDPQVVERFISCYWDEFYTEMDYETVKKMDVEICDNTHNFTYTGFLYENTDVRSIIENKIYRVRYFEHIYVTDPRRKELDNIKYLYKNIYRNYPNDLARQGSEIEDFVHYFWIARLKNDQATTKELSDLVIYYWDICYLGGTEFRHLAINKSPLTVSDIMNDVDSYMKYFSDYAYLYRNYQ